jgi:Trk K+ transport system NAD-binding subunit/nucleotide-binding universal stress UspA family protein
LQTLFDAEVPCALVSVAGSDEVNLEVGRLGRAQGYQPVIAVVHKPANAIRFSDERITALDSAQLLADQVERALKHSGAIMPSRIGLGLGELVQIRLLATSPILHRPLKNLAPHRWRVAAVFRAESLIVPTGETSLQEDDRVLLVGDPDILATVSEYLRLGTPQFPRPIGPNVVTLEFDGSDESLAAEAEDLAKASLAVHLVRGTPGANDTTPDIDADPLTHPTSQGLVEHSSFALPRLSDPVFGSKLAQQRPGVTFCRPLNRGLMARLLGTRGMDADLCDRSRAPVIFARGKQPYKRILLPVSDSTLNIRSAEMAIDISRQLGATITAVNVDLPRHISGLSEAEVHFEVVPIRRLCELYEVPLDYRHREGNPIRRLVEESGKHDLMLVVRRFARTDNYFNPDVALRLARHARCSVLVLTVRPEV